MAPEEADLEDERKDAEDRLSVPLEISSVPDDRQTQTAPKERWIQLRDEAAGEDYYFCEATQVTQVSPPPLFLFRALPLDPALNLSLSLFP